MKKLLIALLIGLPWSGVFAQDHKHEEPKAEKNAPAKTAAEPAKTGAMKCCEGMDKMGEMKAGMPMKMEMKDAMKAKMKAMMADKPAEKSGADASAKSPAEKTPASKDVH